LTVREIWKVINKLTLLLIKARLENGAELSSQHNIYLKHLFASWLRRRDA
jgi:hypothetical protein